MNVYEQQARALKEIAAELKGIRRALDIIGKSLKPDGYRADVVIFDELAGQVGDQAVEQEDEAEAFVCDWTGVECSMCVPHYCVHRVKRGANNG